MSDRAASRRAALRILAGWSGCAAVAGIVPVGGCFVRAGASQHLTPLAKLADIPDGSALRTTLRGEPVLLVNDAGSVRALSGLCTHESCELGWNAEQRLIRCPCHGSAFDPRGRVVKGPATEALPVFRTERRSGTVFVVD